MTQEKQTSIRILQSKPTKKSLAKSSVFLLGMMAGIIVSTLCFFIFLNNNNSSQNLTTTTDTAQSEEISQPQTPNEDNNSSHHDDGTVAYKQHMNDKDFNKIFKHETKPAIQQKPTGSPFEQMIKPENKPTIASVPKPPTAIAKPNLAQTKDPKPKVNSVVAEEISPEGSVKMSIDRKVVENNP